MLNGGANFHAEMAKHINKAGHAPAALINQLARTWDKRYKCEAKLTDTGWRFKSADGTRHDAAQKQWDREVRPYDATPMSNRGGARSAQQDAVAKLVAAYGKLSAAEKRKFKASI
jgi:hypothetical protein